MLRFFTRTDPDDPLALLERRLGYRFRDRALLERALTHRSYQHERQLERNYERLEFLGDAVLGMVTAAHLFHREPDSSEGGLSKKKSYLVSEKALAGVARELELGEVLRLGVGEERSGGRRKRSLLCDAMEAVIGAVYLDGGMAAAERVVRPLLHFADGEGPSPSDAKTELQELAQSRGWALPRYRHVADEGPDHRKLFEVECWVEGECAGRGSGRSKKRAEQAAAAAALDRLIERRGAAEPPPTGC